MLKCRDERRKLKVACKLRSSSVTLLLPRTSYGDTTGIGTFCPEPKRIGRSREAAGAGRSLFLDAQRSIIIILHFHLHPHPHPRASRVSSPLTALGTCRWLFVYLQKSCLDLKLACSQEVDVYSHIVSCWCDPRAPLASTARLSLDVPYQVHSIVVELSRQKPRSQTRPMAAWSPYANRHCRTHAPDAAALLRRLSPRKLDTIP